MIIYTPLDIPKIEPNNWDEWWEVWATAEEVFKHRNTHNNFNKDALWKGLDLYRRTDNFKKYHAYQAPLAPNVPVVQDLVEQIHEHCIFSPLLIRVIENIVPVLPHSDYPFTGKYEFRAMMWDTYKTPTWTFNYNGEDRKLVLPNDTNSFWYLDNPVTHASIYDPKYSKGLLQVYGTPKSNASELLDRSINKYKDIAWVT